jgi:hypothetical protein
MGETGDSRRNPGWDDAGKIATIPNEFRESCRRSPRFEIRADNGRFRNPKCSPRTTLASRDAVPLSPPLFPQKIFCHNHNGRVLRFGVQSSLGCDGEKTGSLAPFSNDSQASLDAWSYSTLGLILGDTFSKKDSGVVVMEGAYVAGPGL